VVALIYRYLGACPGVIHLFVFLSSEQIKVTIMGTINWGILGAGKIAEKFVSDFAFVENGKVVAVASRDIQKSSGLAAKYRVQKSYGSYHEMLKDPTIDVVYIATPHNFHFEHTLMCFEYGKHVLCEKPITVNAQQLRILITKANEKNLFLMEALWTAFIPSIRQMMDWISENRIGKITLIQAEFGFIGNADPNGRLYNPGLAGGALLDIGIYPLTFAQMVAQSEIESFQVQAVKSATGIDVTNAIQIKYANGTIAQLASSVTTSLQNRGMVYGEHGRIEIPEFWKSKKVDVFTNGASEGFVDGTSSWGYCHEASHVNEMLLAKKHESHVMPLSRSLQMVELMDALRNEMGIIYPFE